MVRIIPLLLVLAHAASFAAGAHFTISTPPRERDKFKSADWAIWIPGGVKRIRSIIIHQHGCGRNGITMPHDLHWQALARKHDAALMGSHLVPNGPCTDWHEPENGSNDAFLGAIKSFAEQSDHPELIEAPWCLWGHSGGAHWAFAMTNRHPHRVVATFARSGGQDVKISPEALGVPVMFQLGAREAEGRFTRLYNTAVVSWQKGRAQEALWSLAIDPKSEHDTRNSRLMAIPFFDACLGLRLPSAGNQLKTVESSVGWMGDPFRFSIQSGDSKEKMAHLSWLPNEAVARVWKEFVTTGSVMDKTPPSFSRDLKISTSDGTGILTWTTEADLESGLKAFVIYRKGKKIGTVAGPAALRTRDFFQAGNYGDEPEPVDPKMEFVVPGGDVSEYEVRAVNGSGVESK